ncbi:MAG: guanylate kinase [Flavobacteriales bacterium]|nr:guanylate kinase [Flavobacteriales bacterium]|tara:strand:- start:524 stop:1114 length:591 start_codon:yes stop_codon:yes gene_type:complete
MSQNKNPKLLIIISSPSGAGKTSVCKKILENNKGISISISDTTRPARNNEVDGIDYNFISSIEFDERIKKNLYIEYAKVFNNYYGSQKKNIIKLFNEGKDVLFDIDWQGAKQLRESNYSKILSIFIVPPSKEAIYERLKFRTEKSGGNNQDIENRMKQFEIEMSHKDEYDFIVMNDDFETCVKRIESIILDERKKN